MILISKRIFISFSGRMVQVLAQWTSMVQVSAQCISTFGFCWSGFKGWSGFNGVFPNFFLVISMEITSKKKIRGFQRSSPCSTLMRSNYLHQFLSVIFVFFCLNPQLTMSKRKQKIRSRVILF